MHLQEELKQLRNTMQQQAPAAIAAITQSAQELKQAGLLSKGLKVGDKAVNFALPNPLQGKKTGDKALNFSLPNAMGERVELRSLLRKGPVVLNFYRGGWCPYCNLELMALQRALPDFKALRAELVAISPQSPDNTISTVEKKKLAFTVLSDIRNEVARSFGILYEVPPYLRTVYEGFGVNLSKHNAAGTFELPIPATYVIDSDSTIRFAFANEDFTIRTSIEDIKNALRQIVPQPVR